MAYRKIVLAELICERFGNKWLFSSRKIYFVHVQRQKAKKKLRIQPRMRKWKFTDSIFRPRSMEQCPNITYKLLGCYLSHSIHDSGEIHNFLLLETSTRFFDSGTRPDHKCSSGYRLIWNYYFHDPTKKNPSNG